MDKIVQVYHVVRSKSRLYLEVVETYRTLAEAEAARDYANYIYTDDPCIKAVIKVESHRVTQ